MSPRLAGLLLAGGLGRRMGGVDKALLRLGERTLLEHGRDRLAPQVVALALSANGAPETYAFAGLPILADATADHPGPVAGVLAGLRWAADIPRISHLLTAPVDAPFLPLDLGVRLMAAAGEGGMAWAESGGRAHPVAAVWPLACTPVLAASLAAGQRRVMACVTLVVERFGGRAVTWPATPDDPFANLNTPEDLAAARAALRTACA